MEDNDELDSISGEGRVKKLLERFQKKSVTVTAPSSSPKSTSLNRPAPSSSPKSTSLNRPAPSSSPKSTSLNRFQPVTTRNRASKQTSVGIYQRRSILRRKSKSNTDVRSNGRSSVANNGMSKSCSQGECLSEQVDLLTAIRRDALRKSVMQSSTAVAAVTTLTSSSVGSGDASRNSSLFVQSMYAGSSTSYSMEQGRERRNRPKPPPPVKPTKLRSSNFSRQAQRSFPPVVNPKPFISRAASELPNSPASAALLSETVISSDNGENNVKRLVSALEITTTSTTEEAGTSLITESEAEPRTEKGKSEPCAAELTRSCLSTGARNVTTTRRKSFINEEIKKPKTKPPPPPTQSPLPSSSLQSRMESSKYDSIRKKLQIEITQVVMNDPCNSPPKPHRFERKCIDGEEIPSIPSIPPPLPPVQSPQDSINDGMYEEIEQLAYSEENGEIDDHNTTDENIDEILTPSANFDESGQDKFCAATAAEEEKSNNLNNNSNGHSNNDQSVATMRGSDAEQHYIKNRGNSTTGLYRREMAAGKRPKSALEFDKLLRIKSDIHLNITKKVGQIKLKVSSASSQEKERRKRLSSMFYADRDELKNRKDDEVLAKIEFPLDEQRIYGDDWSSDEDDTATTTTTNTATTTTTTTTEQHSAKQEQIENQTIETQGEVVDADVYERYSMLSEIERELRLRFQADSNLPDVVLESKRRSVSSDTLPQCPDTNAGETADASSNGSKEVNDQADDSDYGAYGRIKSIKLRPTIEGYETVMSPIASSPERNHLPSTSSEYTLKDIDRSVYTPRIIPDPQPLYQIYMMEQNERLVFEDEEQEASQPSFSGVSNSKVQRAPSTASTDSGHGADCSTTVSQLTSNTSMRRDRLIAGSHFGSQRSLWCELPEVKNAGLLETLDDETKKLQEAFFEVITSEASYLRSVNILITHFMAAPEMLGSKGPSSVITNEERKHLFSNIFAVRDCSERLLSDLENRLQSNLVLPDVCDILCDHFETNFDPYVKYCSNQVYQDRTLRKLKSENPSFLSCIQRLESDRLCQGLDMRSFLMLPMQRVTRYPLLVIAILERTQQDTTNYQTAQIALHLANHIVSCCNEGARRMERTEQLLEIERRLVYKSSDLKRIPLVSSGRYLVKRGSLTCLNERRSKKLLQTRQQFQTIYFFLFSDIIMLTKKKVNGTYVCKDYSARRFVDIEPVEIDDPKLLQSVIAHIPLKKPHLFICTLMHNARGKQVELLLNADSETDRERWLSALRPPACSNPEEKIYADWDCPQAVAVHQYTPGQEDELPLEKGDLVNILRKMPDGWLYGERVRDSYNGWFPSSYVQQVLNDHVRAKNYRQRLRVIQAAADLRYHQEQMKTETEENVRHAPHLMDRFRRLSNAKNMSHG